MKGNIYAKENQKIILENIHTYILRGKILKKIIFLTIDLIPSLQPILVT